MSVARAADHSVSRVLNFLSRSFSMLTSTTADDDDDDDDVLDSSMLIRCATWSRITPNTYRRDSSSLPPPYPPTSSSSSPAPASSARWKEAAASLLSARARQSLWLSNTQAKEMISASSCSWNSPPSSRWNSPCRL